MEKPLRLYVHMPSVRPLVRESLARWFIHALEARASEGALTELDDAAKRTKSPEQRKILESMAGRLRKRNLLGKAAIPDEIHFVVADNTAYFLGKPVKQTHTPETQRFVRLLNAVGNRHGIFVHYITPVQMEAIKPKVLLDDGEFFHIGAHGPKLGPGGAKNVALSYIRTLHGKRGVAYLLSVDDDMYPTLGGITGGKTVGGYRNFFTDAYAMHSPFASGGSSYRGFFDCTGVRASDNPKPDLGMFLADPRNMPLYSTEVDEDKKYLRGEQYKSRSTHPHVFYKIPGYLINLGKETTWGNSEGLCPYDLDVFGKMPFSEDNLAKNLGKKFVRSVLKTSGISVGRG
ncbi:Uncharacterised protein [Candidatus Norongarragalina meridionalis]|nr:Uncharacterised protein [Candidatus Norongarragalina meridionalis]